jgi:hypothetical protein
VTGGSVAAAVLQRKGIAAMVSVVARPIHAISIPKACLFEMPIFVLVLLEAKRL